MHYTLCHTPLFTLLNLLSHQPLPGGPYYLWAPWFPMIRAPPVVLVVLAPSCTPLWLAPPVGQLQWFQVAAVAVSSCLGSPSILKDWGNWFYAQPVCGWPAYTLQKNIRNRCYNCKGDEHFGCVQQAQPCCHKWTCIGGIASPQLLHSWLTCDLVCFLSFVIVLNSLLQSLHLITLSLCSPKCSKYSGYYWLNDWVQYRQA